MRILAKIMFWLGDFFYWLEWVFYEIGKRLNRWGNYLIKMSGRHI